MKHYWKTKDGTQIEYKKLEDSHLLNILNLIQRKTREGMTRVYGDVSGDDPDMWFGEIEEIYGKDVLDEMNYEGLLKEAKRRGLIN